MSLPRIGLLAERKSNYPRDASMPPDANSELLSTDEEAELLEGLGAAGFDVTVVGDCGHLLRNLDTWRSRCDLVFNRSVGYKGSERKALAASILEAAGIAYTGSRPYALELTRNKYHAKLVAADAGARTPPAVLVLPDTPKTALDRLPYPVIVKPNNESSSIGVSPRGIVHNPADAHAYAMSIIEAYRQPAIAEGFVEGLELEVPVMVDPETRALGVCAVKIAGRYVESDMILSSETVYDDSYDNVAPPPGIDVERVGAEAVRIARALSIRDYGRVDFRVPRDATPMFIECSTHPHIQRHSSFFAVALRHGMSYADMLRMIVRGSMMRYDPAGTWV